MKDLVTNEKHLLPRCLDCVLILHSLFLKEKSIFCAMIYSIWNQFVCVYMCMCVCVGQKNTANMKRKRMGTVFGIWLQRGYLMIWERLNTWRKLGDLLYPSLLQHGWAQQGLDTSCVTSNSVTLVHRFHSTVEQEGGYIHCKGFFSQNHSGLIAVCSNFNFFYISIMRCCYHFPESFGVEILGKTNRETVCELSEQ